MVIDEDVDKLLEHLPLFIKDYINTYLQKEKIIEIVMDLGRRPEVRLTTGSHYLSQKLISWQDIDYTTKRISKFNNENRAGIGQTLHRISCIRNRQFLITGLTCRIGRAIFGTIALVRDLLESGNSLLILGKPGVGKTTIIREIARVFSDEMEKRVIIIDTSNEIAGSSDIPHSAIGHARRMQVSQTSFQHQIMIEAIENHMPQVIIIDEIGTELESLAARTIAEKGIQLVGTTHGNCLKNLIKNPSLSELVGGIRHVTLSDDEAKRRNIQKTILERKAFPTFQIAIEINKRHVWTIHESVKDSVDVLLRGCFIKTQRRQFFNNQKILIRQKKYQFNTALNNSSGVQKLSLLLKKGWISLNDEKNVLATDRKQKKLIIYSYSISYNLITEVIWKLRINFILTKEITRASLIIGLTKHLQQNTKLKKFAEQKNVPIYRVQRSSIYQVAKLIQFVMS